MPAYLDGSHKIRRALQSFVLAVLRTNWFQLDANGQPKPYISFKIDSSRLSVLDPVVPFRGNIRPLRGCESRHLRSGAVARGGLRWSRPDRGLPREVLGLVKTQSVKDAHRAEGAKGALELRSEEVSAADGYATFIRGLLDITDNIVDGVVRHRRPDRLP